MGPLMGGWPVELQGSGPWDWPSSPVGRSLSPQSRPGRWCQSRAGRGGSERGELGGGETPHMWGHGAVSTPTFPPDPGSAGASRLHTVRLAPLALTREGGRERGDSLASGVQPQGWAF